MYDCTNCGKKDVNGGMIHFCAEGLAGLPSAGRIDGYVLGTFPMDEAFSRAGTVIPADTCTRCSGLYPTGSMHFCADLIGTQALNQQIASPAPSKTPHKCVVCGGLGQVQYDPAYPFMKWDGDKGWPCHACHGTGVLWG